MREGWLSTLLDAPASPSADSNKVRNFKKIILVQILHGPCIPVFI